jgi:glutamate formiminotransferase/formiminotetrahydrofolate cyclodeaminase
MKTLVECVPNFSEGREARKLESIVQAMLGTPDVWLLDREMDADHNRSVVTLVGTKESIGPAALRGIQKAAELIDLNVHRGAHPRIGATDVVPFIPVTGVTLSDCVRIAEWVAEEAWLRFQIPTYLYEAAARRPDRKNLENIRRGNFEGLREEVRTNPDRRPDFGPAELHPTAGATVVGARKFLIAYNINLNSSNVGLARAIARKIRTSSGGLPCVKAMGVELKSRNLAQVSMNLTDFEATPIETVFDIVTKEAAACNVGIAGSEIVGLIPRRALEGAAVHYLKIENYHPDLIFENRLEQVIEEQSTGASRAEPQTLRSMAERFVASVAAPTPAPGGGSVSALAGALAAALGEMVCSLTLKRNSFEAHHPQLESARSNLVSWRERMLVNVDRDAQSYNGLLAALRLPKATEAERAARLEAVEKASKSAAEVPLETAVIIKEILRTLKSLPAMTIPAAASDLMVAQRLAEAGFEGSVQNVRVNLSSVRDRPWASQVEQKIKDLESP